MFNFMLSKLVVVHVLGWVMDNRVEFLFGLRDFVFQGLQDSSESGSIVLVENELTYVEGNGVDDLLLVGGHKM